jgi:circadian clock protein KaiB
MPEATTFKFRLYVADNLLNSAQARKNLAALCLKHLQGRCEIELVDIFHAPQRAQDDGVSLAPTLIRLQPLPQQRITGTLGHEEATAQALGIGEATAP